MLAYALLGQGRCLAALGKPEAEEPLREAKELFASMGYGPYDVTCEYANPPGILVRCRRGEVVDPWRDGAR
jgi:hypothetical protein